MKTLPLIFIIVYCAACSIKSGDDTSTEKVPLNSNDTTIALKDSLGTITLSFPNRYDTFFTWTDESDCNSCGYEKYRFQPKVLPITMETGMIWDGDPKDSIERLTISHYMWYRFSDTAREDIIKQFHFMALENARTNPNLHSEHVVFDTIQRINNRPFSLIVSDFFDVKENQYSKSLTATTINRGNPITVTYYLLTKQKDSITSNFLKNSLDLLKTVRL